jgi:hypothetical protein
VGRSSSPPRIASKIKGRNQESFVQGQHGVWDCMRTSGDRLVQSDGQQVRTTSLVYAKRQAPSIRVFESQVSQPAPAVGRFKSARQEAAFGPEQASDFLFGLRSALRRRGQGSSARTPPQPPLFSSVRRSGRTEEKRAFGSHGKTRGQSPSFPSVQHDRFGAWLMAKPAACA